MHRVDGERDIHTMYTYVPGYLGVSMCVGICLQLYVHEQNV